MAKPKIELDIDDDQIYDMLSEFDGKDSKKAIRTALRRTAAQITKDAKRNLKSKVKNVTKQNPKYKDKLINAIRHKVYKNSDGTYYFKAHVMGTRKSGSGTFRARFFETGTKKRVKGGHNRGSIKSTNFFRDAYVGKIEDFKKNLDEQIKKVVFEINMKKRT